MRRLLALFLFAIMMGPITGSIAAADYDARSEWSTVAGDGLQWIHSDQTFEIPEQTTPEWVDDDTPWWERTNLDQNRNGIHDALESTVGVTGIGLVYQTQVTQTHLAALDELGLNVVDVLEAVNGVLLGQINTTLVVTLAALEDVVMVEKYGNVIFYGDVQTPAVKASNSSFYPVGAWDLGVSGAGVNIAMVDTGVDNEHPGLSEKFVAGYDAVCYLHTDPTCLITNPGRETDGTFDPDDGNQHGTACMGMAAATGIDASGAQTEFYGSAPDAALVDVRIGTDAGAGPFENYVLEQEFYESAMNGIQWIIDNKDTAWQDADGTNYGIDILSLSWGITSHEGGGSDGGDMHSEILNVAMEAGIVVSVAAGNDGPSNEGLSGMGSSSLSVTVGATDDLNTVNREDDTIAGYSSRGPRADNGDGNPLNELKPEISAPGSNIIQAEGCVTSGSCSNLLSDASGNGYTSRGSGTSYATPAVSGIMALMLEANPDLSPAEIKEILKLTAERRGEATQPDVDPFWNRDFGWGMADAYEATKMAFLLKEQNLTGAVDVFTQVHIVNASMNSSSDLYVIEGMAWSQASSVSAVEYRIGNGAWKSASFDETSGQLASLQRFTWTIALDLDALEKGNQSLEIRGVNDAGVQSLPISTMVMGTGAGISTAGEGFTLSLTIGSIIVLFMLLATLLNARAQTPLNLMPNDSEASIEAVIEADAEMADAIDAILVEQSPKGKKSD
tara:strand:+ start:134 stop:2323 length:2190 start_codon:yes stop_codon:yes gene_type:complete